MTQTEKPNTSPSHGSAPHVPLIEGFAPLANQYKGLICDLWGVVHNGQEAFPAACEALKTYRAQGGYVLLLSNAPRPSANVVTMLDRMNVPKDAYDDILTSGDATRDYLASLGDTTKCFYIGPDRDQGLLPNPDSQKGSEEEAEYILCSGLYDDETETPENYTELLKRLFAQGLKMICANPDVVVHRGEKMIYAAGALAQAYEKLGGEVRYFGKPHGPIYDAALERFAGLKNALGKSHLLAIGDGHHTDIRGAQGQNIDALFITGGIAAEHVGETPAAPNQEKLNTFCAEHDITPQAAMPYLVW